MDDELTIPKPPGATTLAFCKHSGICFGIVLASVDGQWRKVPQWLTKTIEQYLIWDGIYMQYQPVAHVDLEWRL